MQGSQILIHMHRKFDISLLQQLNIILILAITIISILIFDINLQYLVFVILGISIAYTGVYIEKKSQVFFVYSQMIVGIALFIHYYTNFNLMQIKHLILGVNLFYIVLLVNQIYKRISSNTMNVSTEIYQYHTYLLLNIFLILPIIFTSKIPDLAGSNNLNLEAIVYFVPAIIIIIIAYSLLTKLIVNYTNIYKSILLKVLISSLILVPIFFTLSYSTFQEIGTETFFIPLVLSYLVYIVEELTSEKNRGLSIFIIISAISSLAFYFNIRIFDYNIFNYFGSFIGVALTFSFTSMIVTLVSKPNYSFTAYLYPIYIISIVALFIDKQGIIPIINIYESNKLLIFLIALTAMGYIPTLTKKYYMLLERNSIANMFPITYGLTVFVLIYFLFKTSALTLDNVIISLITVVIISYYNLIQKKELRNYYYLLPVLQTISLFALIYSL